MSIIDNIKDVAKVLQQADNIDLYKKILNIQADAMKIQEKVIELKRENKILKEKLKIKEKIHFENDTYWLVGANKEKEGPFCSRCYDEKDKLIRMHNKGSVYACPLCKTCVDKPGGNGVSSIYG